MYVLRSTHSHTPAVQPALLGWPENRFSKKGSPKLITRAPLHDAPQRRCLAARGFGREPEPDRGAEQEFRGRAWLGRHRGGHEAAVLCLPEGRVLAGRRVPLQPCRGGGRGEGGRRRGGGGRKAAEAQSGGPGRQLGKRRRRWWRRQLGRQQRLGGGRGRRVLERAELVGVGVSLRLGAKVEDPARQVPPHSL